MHSLISTIIIASFLGLPARAQDVSEDSKMDRLGPVKVIGSSEEELNQPNSAYFVKKEVLEQQQQSDVNRVLKQIPGVYVQEEDGFGLRPNIGLRGTHPHRSRKIVILEDGILIGPAPYSAPAAYYTPFMSKIESLEVFKGVASVPYGPNSIGGVINYITRSLPNKTRAEVEVAGGTYDTQKYRGNVGYVADNLKLMFEGTHFQTKGFKKLDNGHDTGFDKNDFLVKGSYQFPTDRPQSLEWKIGYATEISDETYLGLSTEDFEASPYRRYAASGIDQMDWQHEQYQLTYKTQMTANWGLWSTAYFHKFHRDWYRLNNFRGGSSPSISAILANPTDVTNSLYYGILKGDLDSSATGGNTNGDLVIAGNDRFFHSRGIQFGSFSAHQAGDWLHQLTLGLRLHNDQIRRDHTEDIYSMIGGRMVYQGISNSTNKVTDATNSISLSAADEMLWKDFKFTVASRFESVDYTSENALTNTSTTGHESLFVPGAGVLYQINPEWSALAGVNRGFTIIGPSGGESSPEESINYETGFRYSNAEHEFFAEMLYFRADYKNIKGTCSFSSGCTGGNLDQEFDGGKALIQGLEARFAKGFQWRQIYFPLNLNVTVTKAEFAANSVSSNPEWGTGNIVSGDPLPYVPVAQYSLGLGTQYKKYSQEVILSWTGKMYDQSVQANREEIPAYGVVDWSAKYQLNDGLNVYSRVDNIFDNEYLVSLRPFGARPGKARTFLVGLKQVF